MGGRRELHGLLSVRASMTGGGSNPGARAPIAFTISSNGAARRGPNFVVSRRKRNFPNPVRTIRPKIQWGGDVGATDFESGGNRSVTSATSKGFSSIRIVEIRGKGGAVNGSRGAPIGTRVS